MRFSEYKRSAQDPDTTCVVGRHFQEPGHSLDHMEMVGVEKLMGSRDRVTLRQREKKLINDLDLIRHGLNVNR